MDKNIEKLEKKIAEAKKALESITHEAGIVLEEYFDNEGSLELACIENLIERLEVMQCEVDDAKEAHLEYIAEYGDFNDK